MILAYTSNTYSAGKMLFSASQLSINLRKDFAVCCQDNKWDDLPENLSYNKIEPTKGGLSQITEICEVNDISFLFIQLFQTKASLIKKALEDCRDLRIPYIFFKDDFDLMDLSKIILPVNFLEEELEKAQFASAFGRFCDSAIHILQANDYGSKAATNVAKMKELFERFSFVVDIEKANEDSFKVEKEAVQRAENENAGLVIVSASREYGLDDVIFGPKEYHLIKKSLVPVLLVNPRGDLYALCD
jgi:hypothetical protein